MTLSINLWLSLIYKTISVYKKKLKSFLKVEFIGVTLFNKATQVTSVQLRNTSQAYGIVRF